MRFDTKFVLVILIPFVAFGCWGFTNLDKLVESDWYVAATIAMASLIIIAAIALFGRPK